MKTFESFAKARRKKVATGVRPIDDTQRPNASGENTGAGGNRIEEAKKKVKKDRNVPTQSKSNNIGMVSPLKTPANDLLTGNMVGDNINVG